MIILNVLDVIPFLLNVYEMVSDIIQKYS